MIPFDLNQRVSVFRYAGNDGFGNKARVLVGVFSGSVFDKRNEISNKEGKKITTSKEYYLNQADLKIGDYVALGEFATFEDATDKKEIVEVVTNPLFPNLTRGMA